MGLRSRTLQLSALNSGVVDPFVCQLVCLLVLRALGEQRTGLAGRLPSDKTPPCTRVSESYMLETLAIDRPSSCLWARQRLIVLVEPWLADALARTKSRRTDPSPAGLDRPEIQD